MSARLDRPAARLANAAAAPPPLLAFGHGAGAGLDHPLIEGLAAAFVAAGITVLRYQFPFMERLVARGGAARFGRDPLPVAVATVAAAVACARSRSDGGALFAGGHSYGARMTTQAAAAGRLDGVRGGVLLSFPLHAPRKPSLARGAHLDDLAMPLLFLSGSRDTMAEAPLLEELVGRIGAARLVRIDGADHGWKAARRRWPEGVGRALAQEAAAFMARQTAVAP